MSTDSIYTFGKEEHLCKQTLIEQLFGGNAQMMTAWPVRVVWLLVDKKTEHDAAVQVLVSVSKRYFKRAVKRNRVKRQIREAFRLHKLELEEMMKRHSDKQLLIAFIWQADQLLASHKIEPKVQKMMSRLTHGSLAEKLQETSDVED